jgi:hypothetical protein
VSRVARPPGVNDIAGVAILGLPARVEEPLPSRRAPRVGGALRCTARVYRGLGTLLALIVPRTSLLTDARRRTFGLLDDRLFDDFLRLAVQVPCLRRRGGGHGPQQRRHNNELLACLRGCAWIVDIEVGVDAVAGLSTPLPRAFAVRGGFSGDGGPKQLYRTVLLRVLGFKLARLGQLRIDVGPLGGEGGGALGPAVMRGPVPGPMGTSPSPASAASVAFAWLLVITTQHSHAGS